MGRMHDQYRFDVLHDGPVNLDLGAGLDQVLVRSRDDEVERIRLTFVRAEVGDGLAGPGAGLAVSLQAENAAGLAFGPVSRFDDEGITFRLQSPGVKFDIRDIGPSSIGLFDVAVFGTRGSDHMVFSRERADHYVHGGMGDDRIFGGRGNDYVIGGPGNDQLRGGDGDDILVGGPGADRLFGGRGNDTAVYRLGFDGSDRTDLGQGHDMVVVTGPPGEVRLTLATLQIGNGKANDSGSLPNEDGGLALRLQAEDAAGNPVGETARFDDEGVSFTGAPGITFDIRDLPTGLPRGSGYHVVRLGSSGDDLFDDRDSAVRLFQNGGAGDDVLIGGSADDHLIGIDGDDRLEGGAGDDILVGLAGSDTFVYAGDPGTDSIYTFEPGKDRIDLSAYGIDFGDVEARPVGTDSFIGVDTDSDGVADFEIILVASGPPLATDYIF